MRPVKEFAGYGRVRLLHLPGKPAGVESPQAPEDDPADPAPAGSGHPQGSSPGQRSEPLGSLLATELVHLPDKPAGVHSPATRATQVFLGALIALKNTTLIDYADFNAIQQN